MRTNFKESTKRIVLGVTGSIAVYKALELVRLLKKEGFDVWVVMTESAKKFVAPLSFQTLSQNPVFSELFTEKETLPVHIDLTRDTSVIVVAPATANIIAKAASGIADDLLSTVLLSATSPVIFVPAMNHRMWESPITQKNISYLKSLGFTFIEPEIGELACEEIGKGRFPPIEHIFQELKTILYKKEPLKGKKVVITAGRTEEPIDPIRILTNRSSGKMSIELAKAANEAGAKVKLIAGNLTVLIPPSIETKQVRSTKEMLDAINQELGDTDVFIMAAAVSDYRLVKIYRNKHKEQELELKLTRTPDILKTITQKKHKAYMVGFSLDTKDNINEAKRKLKQKNLRLIVANPVETLDRETIKPTVIYNKPNGIKLQSLPAQTKKSFAEKLMKIIMREIKE